VRVDGEGCDEAEAGAGNLIAVLVSENDLTVCSRRSRSR